LFDVACLLGATNGDVRRQVAGNPLARISFVPPEEDAIAANLAVRINGVGDARPMADSIHPFHELCGLDFVAHAPRGIRLVRTQTPAGGASHRDFRFSRLPPA
jgi:hypothetical protein